MNAPLSGGVPPLAATPPPSPLEVAAKTLAQQAPAAPPITMPPVINLTNIVTSTVKAELAKLKLEGVTFEHKIGVAVLKYWPIAAGLAVAATRFL